MSRVAIVGGGPRALWALERLLAVGLADAQVDVFTGGSRLGVGSAYALDQPPWLRMNVASSSVDVWSLDPGGGPSYDAWARGATDPFPPRARTGAYLAEQAETVLARLGDRVRVHADRVGDLARAGDGWRLDVAPGSRWDHVLLATGHETDWPGALRHGWASHVPLQPAVLPVDGWPFREEVHPGSTVVVRGAALTAIDAVLSLVSSVGRDLRIVLTSRSGLLMHPKTEADVLAGLIDWEASAAQAADLVADRARPITDVLAEVADRLPGARRDPPVDVSDGAHRDDAVSELRHALAVARGEEPPDRVWAQAQAWRLAYPAMVRRQAATDPFGPVLGHPDWVALAARMERLAFGPPPVNAAALLELVDAGVVEVRRGDAAAVAAELDADLVVDAVLPPPGVRSLMPDSLLGRLLARGLLTPAPHGRGALVDGQARVLDAEGRVVPGLALVGRASEDVVIGNDTLIRTLHPYLTEWARHV